MDTLEVRPLAKGLGWFVTWRVEFSALAWGCHLTLTPLIDWQSVRGPVPAMGLNQLAAAGFPPTRANMALTSPRNRVKHGNTGETLG